MEDKTEIPQKEETKEKPPVISGVKEKAGRWANFAYKVFMTVAASLILKGVTTLVTMTTTFISEFKQLQVDRDKDIRAHIAQIRIDSVQDVKMRELSTGIAELNGTVAAHEEKIIELIQR